MKTVFSFLLAILAGVGLVTVPTSAQAATNNASNAYYSDTIWVETSLNQDRWPVRDELEDLDNGSDLNLVWGKCPTVINCIKVVSYDFGSSLTTGVARMWVLDGRLHHAEVRLHTDLLIRKPLANRRKTIIHELGHSVGMTHTTRTGSIMISYNTSDHTPDTGDRDKLKRLYGNTQ